jgi:hypothetical protein
LRALLQGKSIFGVNLGDNWNRVNSRDLIGFLGGLIRQIKGLIIRIYDGQLWTSLKKSKTMDQIVKNM